MIGFGVLVGIIVGCVTASWRLRQTLRRQGSAPPQFRRALAASSIMSGIVGGVLAGFASEIWVPQDNPALAFFVTVIGAVLSASVYSPEGLFRLGRAMRWIKAKTADAKKTTRGAFAKRQIFISYRQADDGAQAGRISDRLKNEFEIFMDVESIRAGVDFVEAISEAVAKCDALIALMGRNWLDVQAVR
jgi:hypothetical protein